MRRGSGDDAWIIVAWHATAGTRSVVIPMEDASPLQWENTTIKFLLFFAEDREILRKTFRILFGLMLVAYGRLKPRSPVSPVLCDQKKKTVPCIDMLTLLMCRV